MLKSEQVNIQGEQHMDNKVNYKELGYMGENIASRYLMSRDYRILDRNYKKHFGEIDLIVEKDDCVSFVEVKTKLSSGNNLFTPELRVDRKKISHISKVASVYLDNKGWLGKREWQIDIVSVIISESDKKARIKHFQNVASDIY